MAKEGSVAPKERVNIVYKPATGDAQAEIELPLKMMVMGDFTLREDETPLEDRKVVNVDKDNFSEVMGKQNLNLTFNVADRLSGAKDAELPVNLNFKDLKDFEPGAVARQVPELAKMLELRDALTALKGPLANVPAFRKKIEALLKDPEKRDKLIKELGLDESGAEKPE
ncbi:MAG: type VI secretion system contractile sheath small subunit [Candidatus Eisenbacteria bacterium]|uniref:Type VI secretion system contractile sheath small subunit n=1 Tax=Eiseniibacteriota bacterium TaxID=2212470 RepID=A0A948S0Y5_UNCEI|nr:type VI secretion system contractile sheath small subunit [Candidatus Eisenbacteria bacterium]MBU2692832.1 type VI secretion system contractile sheath small subunit [Candidatus Eisenbacteria bacterium]